MRRCGKCQHEFDDSATFCPTDGELLTSFNFDSLVGQVLDGRYRIDAKLGEGAHGVVYQAIQLDIERPVALKLLHPCKVLHPNLLAQITDIRGYWLTCLARFRREARAAGRIRHPNVIAVTGFGTVGDDMAYIVMEYLVGNSLRALLKASGKLEPAPALRILRHVAWAVECAHRQGVIHRDLKPANIFLETVPGMEDVVKVLDFGIAKLAGTLDSDLTSLTDTGIMLGTPRYMSPEQCGGRDIDARSDIYSLGVVLYEMLAGTAPFTGPTMAVAIQHETRPARPLAELVPTIPAEINDLVMRCLRKNPDDRPQTAEAVARAVEAVIPRLTADSDPTASSSRIVVNLDAPAQPSRSGDSYVTIPDTMAAPPVASEEKTTIKEPSAALQEVPVAPSKRILPPDSDTTRVRPPKVPAPVPPKGMIYIPEGEFVMGSDLDLANERPAHRVFVGAFFMDSTEVTNRRYREFCDRTKRRYPPGLPGDPMYFLDKPDHPVVNVSWEDAAAFAAWAGKRLPTEAEWEKAARAGLDGKRYPWGDDITPGHANFNLHRPMRVASYFPNAFGLYDIIGNVWEWCSDWYDENYYAVSPNADPKGPTTGREKVLRGGSTEGGKAALRVSFRHWMPPTTHSSDIGFRCVRDVIVGGRQ